jgi:hypothetical protein
LSPAAHNTQLFSLKTAMLAIQSAANGSAATQHFTLGDVFELPPLVWAVQAFTIDMHE